MRATAPGMKDPLWSLNGPLTTLKILMLDVYHWSRASILSFKLDIDWYRTEGVNPQRNGRRNLLKSIGFDPHLDTWAHEASAESIVIKHMCAWNLPLSDIFAWSERYCAERHRSEYCFILFSFWGPFSGFISGLIVPRRSFCWAG